MMEWETLPKPAEAAESRLITAILSGRFPIGSNLPAERELAGLLGVTRPTLREALQRLARDGWIEIHHGRSTRVRNYWQEGNLGVLSAIAQYPEYAPDNFVPDLLAVRLVMAPAYFRQAFERSYDQVQILLQGIVSINDSAVVFAFADWELHHQMTVLSGNPIYALILNGFAELYLSMAEIYFNFSDSRAHSRRFYQKLSAINPAVDLDEVERLVRDTMAESLVLWRLAQEQFESREIAAAI